MNFKKAIVTGVTVAFLFSPVLNVSAAPAIPDDYVQALRESGVESLILDVDAYRSAYSDLAEAFGDDTDAYIAHYLTTGIYEGRTAGALFNPLVYAEAYGDVKEAFGNDIAAIVNHYVTLGIAENRTMGTAGAAAGIAETGSMNGPVAPQTELSDIHAAADVNASEQGGAVEESVNTAGSVAPGSSTNSGAGSTASSGGTGSTGTAGSTNSAASANTGNGNRYHHTTSIYSNDESTLLRVEYYDSNNKLFEFSQVTNHDSETNSYTEDIYSYDEESDTIVHERTDVYVNGSLSSSEEH